MKRVVALLLACAIVLSMAGCSRGSSASSESVEHKTMLTENVISEDVATENIEEENIITEDVINEYITEEIYLEELVVAENEITELLLEEDTINEVLLCKTIYVPQDNLEEFAENSQTEQLFGDDIDLSSVLTKVAVGTGVIVTLVVLKYVGLPEPIASCVVGAASEALKFSGTGAAIGSLMGGLTGAADEIDETGRTSAVIGFAMATAGLILSIVSLATEAPSGGSTTITAAAGAKLVVAGIGLIAAAYGTAYEAVKLVKTFTATDAADIDWDDIDWDAVGVSAAEQSIESTADGYMWGAIIGAVHGGIDGYEFYQKYSTPYTKYNVRLMKTPQKGGHWSGERGESDFILDEPIVLADGTKITKVTYKNCVPDFSPFQKAQVKIPSMTNQRLGKGGNYEQADTALAEYWTKIKYEGKTSWSARDVSNYRNENNLTWHEMSNMENMQLVPSEVNSTFTHYGGVAEYNAMIGQTGVEGFD